MDSGTAAISAHMREFGIAILGRAIYDVTYCETTRPFAHALAAVHAAHGAEIVLKARIAQEHPLLIFNKLPTSTKVSGDLSFGALLEHGHSLEYFELPERLWAATGYRLPHPEAYREFGRLRNQLVHFAVPDIDLSGQTLRFCIEIMEPILHEFWEESAIPIAEVWDDGTLTSDGYLQEQIKRHEITMPLSVKQRLRRRSTAEAGY
jgi:hypothetical protein